MRMCIYAYVYMCMYIYAYMHNFMRNIGVVCSHAEKMVKNGKNIKKNQNKFGK